MNEKNDYDMILFCFAIIEKGAFWLSFYGRNGDYKIFASPSFKDSHDFFSQPTFGMTPFTLALEVFSSELLFFPWNQQQQ